MSDAVVMGAIKLSQAHYNIRVNTNGVFEILDFAVTPNKEYFQNGQSSVLLSDDDFAGKLSQMLNTNGNGGVYSVSILSNGHFKIDCNVPYQILWDDVATDQTIVPYFGHTVTSPAIAGLTSTSPRTCKSLWVPSRAMYRTNWNAPKAVGKGEQALSGVPLGYKLGETADGKFTWLYIAKEETLKRFANDAGDPTNCFEDLWIGFLTEYRAFVVCENSTLRVISLLNPGNSIYRLIDLEEHPEPWIIEAELRNTTFTIELVGIRIGP